MRGLSLPLHLYDFSTKQRTKRLHFILLLKKEWLCFACQIRIERLYFQKLEWNRSILINSPTKRITSFPVELVPADGADAGAWSELARVGGQQQFHFNELFAWPID